MQLFRIFLRHLIGFSCVGFSLSIKHLCLFCSMTLSLLLSLSFCVVRHFRSSDILKETNRIGWKRSHSYPIRTAFIHHFNITSFLHSCTEHEQEETNNSYQFCLHKHDGEDIPFFEKYICNINLYFCSRSS